MGKLAKITNNVVVNVIEGESFKGYITCPENVSKGWLHSKGVFTPPEPVIEEISFENVKKDSLISLDLEHAAILRQLTGDATIEERDTWQLKAVAAAMYSKGEADEYQTDMLTTEATMAGETVQQLVTTILTKNAAFQKMVGLAAGHRRSTAALINEATTIEELLSVVTTAKQTAEELITAYLQAIQNGG